MATYTTLTLTQFTTTNCVGLPKMSTKRSYALVTGADKGIGFEICKQLALKGTNVLLTARNEKKGLEALEKLKALGLTQYLDFHQLDVLDHQGIASLAEYVETNLGRLDILVNNAGINGMSLEGDMMYFKEFVDNVLSWALHGIKLESKADGKIIETVDEGERCLRTNYYAAKDMTEAFVPLLQLSNSPRIVNVSSIIGNLKFITNDWARGVLNNTKSLNQEKLDEVVREFVKNLKEGTLVANGWPAQGAPYKFSKAALNAYTRIAAKKYPNININCVCTGFAATDMTWNLGPLTAAEGAESPVKVALLPHGEPSGLFFYRDGVFPF